MKTTLNTIKILPDLVKHIKNNFNQPDHFNYRKGDRWQSISTEEFVHHITHASVALNSMGVKNGVGVGIISDSSPWWIIMDLSIMIAGGVNIPMFSNASDENIDFQIKDSNMKFLFIASQEKWQQIEKKSAKFKNVITLDIETKKRNALSFYQLCERGKLLSTKKPALFEQLRKKVKNTDLTTLIYTSGSTGLPKGVELTQQNIISQVRGANERFDVFTKDKIISVLPLAHVFERMVMYFFISSGARIFFCDDVKKVGNYMRELHPTVITVVPRLLEKVFAKMKDGVKNGSAFKRVIGGLALQRAMKKDPLLPQNFFDKVFDLLVYKKFRLAMGGQFRLMVCGGAALSDNLYRFFLNIGAPIFQGYGLTEASPVIATNYVGANKIGTVGKAFPDVEVKISSDGEILAKGPNVMKRYHNNPKETKQTIKKGWLYTGDYGKLDEDGYLIIGGRKKELYKSSNGKYISPIPIEQRLTTNSLIEYAMVVADNRNFVTCLLFPNYEDMMNLKKQLNLENLNDQDFIYHPKVLVSIEKHIEKVNQKLNHWEQVRKFIYLDEKLSIENGDLTPKMNIRREKLFEKFSTDIEKMYSD